MTAADETGGGLIEVRLLGVPVGLFHESSRHHEELRREFALITTGSGRDGSDMVPARLLELIEELTARFQAFTTEARRRLDDAVERQEVTVDVSYKVPATVGAAAAEFSDLLDEADRYCRQGSHLLTGPTPAPFVALRRWFLGEFTRQAEGLPPRPWSG